MTPAIMVMGTSPSYPYWMTIAYTMTANVPLGPPICTRLPPSADMMKPPMIAVKMPRSGLTPLAMAKAIASGSETTTTIKPAPRSPRNVFME